MKIHLVSTSDVSQELMAKIYNLLITANGPLDFKSHRSIKKFGTSPITWETIFSSCSQFRQKMGIPDEDFLILFTESRNEANWFSACDPDGTRNIFIQSSDWDYYVNCGAEIPLAYEVIENVLERLMYDNHREMEGGAHEPAIGCISDMCIWKPDIMLKLRTADICSDCLAVLDAKGVDQKLVKQCLAVMENLRPNTLFSSKYQDKEINDSYLPFPVAITRHKIKTASQPYHKLICLIDHFESMVRTSVIMVGRVILKDGFNQFFSDNHLSAKPSLGHWVQALSTLSQQGMAFDLSGLCLPEDTLLRMREIASQTSRERIVELRNERRGHGFADPEEESYKADFIANAGAIYGIEELLKPVFTKFDLVYVLNTDHPAETTFVINTRKLMGSHPDFIEEQIEQQATQASSLPISNQVYLWLSNNAGWQSMHPYILFSQCPECRHDRVLISDGERYLDPYQGHRVTLGH